MKYQNANLSRRLIDLAVSTAFMLLLCALAAMGQDMRTRLEMRRLSEQQMRDREYALYQRQFDIRNCSLTLIFSDGFFSRHE